MEEYAFTVIGASSFRRRHGDAQVVNQTWVLNTRRGMCLVYYSLFETPISYPLASEPLFCMFCNVDLIKWPPKDRQSHYEAHLSNLDTLRAH
jgi:hypothetical protein